MKAVFDTNILIDYLIGNLLAKKEIEQYQSPQISIITKMEILVGVTDNEEIIKEFLNGFNIIPLNDEIAEIAVNIRKENKIKIPGTGVASHRGVVVSHHIVSYCGVFAWHSYRGMWALAERAIMKS